MYTRCDEAGYVRHVDHKQCSHFVSNGPNGEISLEAAIAAEATEYVTCQALAVHANEYRLVSSNVAKYQCDMFS